jgi:pimeloyl-ACP methyl ester carboxylesterase
MRQQALGQSDDAADDTHRFIGPDGTPLAYHVIGDGPPVVCMPGGPGRAAAYLEDLGGLGDDYRLIELDAPGTGDSGRPTDPTAYGFPSLARALEGLRVELGLDRMILLGHSAGALVAEIYAAEHPDRLDALVLVTPAGWLHGADRSDADQIQRRRSNESWYADARATLDGKDDGDPATTRRRTLAFRPFMYGAWNERQQAHAAAADHEQDADAEAGYWQPDQVDLVALRSQLSDLDVPTLVVAGAVDAVTGVDAARAVAAGLANARLTVLDDGGHFPWVDRPTEFRTAVHDFLQQVHKQNGANPAPDASRRSGRP